MRWPWRRRSERPQPVNHTDRLPDGDRVLRPGEPRWADLLRDTRSEQERVLGEATQPLPLTAPLLTFGARWRAGGGQR